jgi:hypothetical protein
MEETEPVEGRCCERFGDSPDKGAFAHSIRTQDDEEKPSGPKRPADQAWDIPHKAAEGIQRIFPEFH